MTRRSGSFARCSYQIQNRCVLCVRSHLQTPRFQALLPALAPLRCPVCAGWVQTCPLQPRSTNLCNASERGAQHLKTAALPPPVLRSDAWTCWCHHAYSQLHEQTCSNVVRQVALSCLTCAPAACGAASALERAVRQPVWVVAPSGGSGRTVPARMSTPPIRLVHQRIFTTLMQPI